MNASQPAPQPDSPPLTRQTRAWVTGGVMLAILLAALDQTIVGAAGPRIQRDLQISPALYTWLTIAYLVTSTVVLPIAGKLGDRLGRRPLVLFGLTVFVLGSLACGFSWNAASLIAFRAFQGLGAGALIAGTTALVADLYPPRERAQIQGLFGAVFGVSSVLGPLFGGLLTDALSWHWVFFVNVPIGAVAVWIIARHLPQRMAAAQTTPLDIAGALSLTGAAVSLLLALSLGSATPQPGALAFAWSSWQILTLLTTFAGCLLAFVLIERRAVDPMIDLRLFLNRTFTLSVTAVFVLGASLLATGVFVPLFLVDVVGVSVTASGLSTTPLMFALIASSIIAGQVVARSGRYKPALLSGLAILIVGFWMLGFTLTPQSTALEVALKIVVVGIGFGPVVSLYVLAVQNALPPERTGVATASVSFFQQLGSTVGLAVLGATFAAILAGAGDLSRPGSAAFRETYTGAISALFRVAALIAGVGMVVTALLPEVPLRATPISTKPSDSEQFRPAEQT